MIGRTRSGRNWWSGLLVLIAIALLVSATPRLVIAQEDEASDEAEIFIVHGASDAGDVDLYVDGSREFSAISYPSVSDALSLPEGDHEVAVVPAGDDLDQAIATTTLTLIAGETYHVAALGLLADLQVNVYAIDRSPLAPGQSRIRVINGSPDTGPLDPLLSGGDPLFPAVSFPNETDYADIDAATVDIELLATDVETVVLSNAAAELTAGTVYDLYAAGQLADDSLRLIQVASSGETTTSASSAAIRSGRCADGASDDDAAVVAQLNGPATASGESLGTADLSPVANAFTPVDLAFDEMLAAEHAVIVNRDAEQASAGVVCGDIGGSLTETGALVVALREADGQTLAGMAILAPSTIEPSVTDVTLLLVSESTSTTDDAPAATEEPATVEPEEDEDDAPNLEGDVSVPEIVVIDNRQSDDGTDTP